MRVSVLTPTFGRPEHHARLYQGFAAQTHPDTELVILDDSPEPSAFFSQLRDERVRYHHTIERSTVGAKRNWLARQARGEILAHFDDDDYYAPTYLATMLTHLGKADFAKLSAFYAFSVTHQAFVYWDTATAARWHFLVESGKPLETLATAALSPAEIDRWTAKNLLGYGFSFVYRKSVHERVPFPDIKHGEDAAFVDALVKGGYKVNMAADQDGIALVVRHQHDHSILCPQFILPPSLLPRLFGPAAAAYVAAV